MLEIDGQDDKVLFNQSCCEIPPLNLATIFWQQPAIKPAHKRHDFSQD